MDKLILIGPMGAGKSSIGRRVAEMLGLPFHDTDQAIQARAGVGIDFIFEKEGEAGFRRREEKVLAELLDGEPAVIATGGGAVLSAANRERMRNGGTVIYLEATVEWQLARTRRGQHRPLLDTTDPATRLSEILAEREPLYRECATITVSTNGRRVQSVASAVLAALEHHDKDAP